MSRQGLRTRWARRVAGLGAVGTVAALALVAVPTAASAAGQDEVSDPAFAFSCATRDNMAAALTFHVDAFGATPAGGRVEKIRVDIAGFDDWDYSVEVLPPEGYGYFVTQDYDLDVDAMRSLQDGDGLTATFLRVDGSTAATVSKAFACFDGTTAATTHDFQVTARAGVPKAVRLLENVTYGSLDAPNVVKARVALPTASWGAGWQGTGAADELVLDPATAAALGATLSDSVLTLKPTTLGDYTLKWGVVTSEDGDDWTPGSGQESAPATVTVHVIERPAPATEAVIVASPHGPVVVPPAARAGDEVPVALGTGYAGQYVDLWLHSDPIYLGLVQVPASGTIRVTLPASAPAGSHKVVVSDEVGTLIGWGEVSVTAAAGTPAASTTPATTNAVPRAATGLDEGAATPRWLAAAVGLTVLAGASLVLRRREAKQRA